MNGNTGNSFAPLPSGLGKAILFGVCLFFFSSVLYGAVADFSGDWQGSWSSPPYGGELSVSLTQYGTTLTGTLTARSTDCGDLTNVPLTGSVVNNIANFSGSTTCPEDGTPLRLDFTFGILSGNTVTGGYSVYVNNQAYDTGTYSIVRQGPPTNYLLSVNKLGTGTGTVTSSPGGINCGSTCGASYNPGTSVTLTAFAGQGSTFTGWSAPCSGTGTCTITLNQSTQVTATFASSVYFDMVQKFYIGYYQRPADAAGLLFWVNALAQIDTTRTGVFSRDAILSILHDFAFSDEARSLYNGDITGNNIATVVNSIYLGLFARPAEPGGLAFYVNGFNSGGETPATILWSVMNGAQGTDALSVQNKVTVAMSFTRVIDPDLDGRNFQVTYAGNADAQAARTYLAAVTSDTATIPTPNQLESFMKSSIADPKDGILNSAACQDVSGGWSVQDSVTVTCSGSFGSGTETQGGSGSVTITQDGCAISFVAPTGAARTGTVSGYNIAFSGIVAQAPAGVTFNQNYINFTGTVSQDVQTMNTTGVGLVSGSLYGQQGSCTVLSTEAFTR